MKIQDGIGILEAKCDRCGKIYVEQPQHIFKKLYNRKLYHFCSWTCYNAHNQEVESKKANKGGQK